MYFDQPPETLSFNQESSRAHTTGPRTENRASCRVVQLGFSIFLSLPLQGALSLGLQMRGQAFGQSVLFLRVSNPSYESRPSENICLIHLAIGLGTSTQAQSALPLSHHFYDRSVSLQSLCLAG